MTSQYSDKSSAKCSETHSETYSEVHSEVHSEKGSDNHSQKYFQKYSEKYSQKYSEKILHFFYNEVGVGAYSPEIPMIFTGEAGSIAQDAILTIQLHIQDALVLDSKYQVYGDPFVIATLGYLHQLVVGRSVDDCRNLGVTELVNELQLPTTKQYCAVHAIEALRAAIREYDRSIIEYDSSAT